MQHWSILGFLKVPRQYTKGGKLTAEKENQTESLVILKHSVKWKWDMVCYDTKT